MDRRIVLAAFLSMFLIGCVSVGDVADCDSGQALLSVDGYWTCKTLFVMSDTYWANNTIGTVIDATGSYKKVNGTTRFTNYAGFTNSSNNNLKYVGSENVMIHAGATISVKSNQANRVVRAATFKNGTIIPGSEIELKLGTAGDVASTAIHYMTTLKPNDYLELYITDMQGTATLTVTNTNLFVLGMPS